MAISPIRTTKAPGFVVRIGKITAASRRGVGSAAFRTRIRGETCEFLPKSLRNVRNSPRCAQIGPLGPFDSLGPFGRRGENLRVLSDPPAHPRPPTNPPPPPPPPPLPPKIPTFRRLSWFGKPRRPPTAVAHRLFSRLIWQNWPTIIRDWA